MTRNYIEKLKNKKPMRYQSKSHAKQKPEGPYALHTHAYTVWCDDEESN